jgi:hypothetical protein
VAKTYALQAVAGPLAQGKKPQSGLADVSIWRKKQRIDNIPILLEIRGFLKVMRKGCE